MALDAAGIERACQAVTQGSEREMLEALADAIVEHLKAGTAGEWGEQALLALAEEWPARADEIMAGYAPKVADEVKAEVRQALIGSSLAEVAAAGTAYLAMRKDDSMAGTDAYTAAERVYRRSQDEGITAKLQRKAEQRADEAAQRAAKAVQRLNLQMEQASAEAYRQAMRDAVAQWVGNERTRAAIVESAVQRLGDAFQVEYASGAKTTVDVAINRALTTELSQTDGDNSLAAMRGLGCQLGITDAHYGARPSHAVWQGRPFGIDGEVTVDGVTYPAMTALTGYGSATGLKGINCRHSINPYWPGITELPDTEFKADRAMHNGMGSDEYYAATQRQRAYERAIRRSKASIAQMERAGIGLESPAYVQERLKLGSQQRSLRSLCSASNMKRQPARERAYGVGSQPRALTATGSANAKRRKAFIGELANNTPTRSNSEMMKARNMGELQGMLLSKHGVSLRGTDGLHFESVRAACAGLDEVLSDFPKASSWIAAEGASLGRKTYMTTSANGIVTMDTETFSAPFPFAQALSTGRHEAGHLLELAMAENAKGDTAADFASAKHSKRILNRALKRMNAETGKKIKLVKAIESISLYPSREAFNQKDNSALYAEGLAMTIENGYNGKAANNKFAAYVLDELRKELG